MVKCFLLIKRKSDVSGEEFSRYWEKQHGPLVVKTFPAIKKYVQNHATKLPGGGEPPFDGIVEVWFDDMESWRATRDIHLGQAGEAIRDDEAKFIDRSKMVFLVAEETVIKA